MKKRFWFVPIIVILLLILGLFSQVKGSNAANSPVLDEKTLTSLALDEAHSYGLSGNPVSQKTVQMTMGKWAALTGGELGKDAAQFGLTPDMPVLVMVVKGNVEWKGPAFPRPGQTANEKYDNMTVVVNAKDGGLMWIGSFYADQPMPVTIP